MKNKLFLLSLFFVLSSCASIDQSSQKNLSIDRFDAITLGQKKKDVVDHIGSPSEVRAKDSKDRELWIYNDHGAESLQRGSITFDTKTNTVLGVTVLPRPADREWQLDYLLKNKFAKTAFEKFALQRCGGDVSPEKVYYINVANGIVIEQNNRSFAIESFFWTTPDYVKDVIEKIRVCKR